MAEILFKSKFSIAALIFILIFSFQAAYAQDLRDTHAVRLKSGTISPKANARQWLDSMAIQKEIQEPSQVLVHFSSLPTESQRQTMAQQGITLLDYLPENTFVAHIKFPLDKEAVLAMPVYSFVNAKPEWKSSDYMWKQINSKKGSVELLVSVFENVDAKTFRKYIAGIGGEINPGHLEKYNSYKVILDASRVKTMADWYGVRCISPVSEMVPLDHESVPAVKGNVATAAQIHGGYNLQGDSVCVGVGDDCSGIYHADINDRITNFNPVPMRNHGAHVNGIVGGSGNLDPFAEGMAPHVALVDFLYDLMLSGTGAMYHDHNMTITNNSYEVIAGDCDYAGTYDVYSRLLDTLSVQYPNVLHVFASGNDGYQHCAPYPQGFATVGGGYQPAKNNVVVGSMTDFYDDVSDESRGPVKDGRLKPEIEATGLIAYSTVGLDAYEWAAGTSMAAPHVAGGLAVLTQRYKQLNGGAQPRADLMKTLLLNGAMDLGNPGPDYSHGFGEMDIYRSLQMIDSGHYTTGDISNGDSQSYTITVPPGTGQLRVMLCWADVPASTSSAKQLVNDLDLSVKDASGTRHLPLVLDPTPANVNKNATEKEDHLNNVEQVTIDNPAPGTYTIRTKGYSIPYGPQHYVVAYDVMPRSLHLTYPLGGEQLLSSSSPFDTIRVFWDAATDGNTFKVEVSQDGGGSWFTIDDKIPAWYRHCDFLPVGLSTGKFVVRLSRNNTSETATSGRFSINPQPLVQLDTAQCPGYINIHWSPVYNATSYYMLRKVGYYMQVVDSTSDTTYTFKGMPLNAASYVSVQPIIDGIPGYRSLAVKTVANSGNCSKAVSAGDLILQKILSPSNGRKYTKSQLGTSDTMKLLVRDVYQSPCDSYSVSWRINAGPWQSATLTAAIPANGTRIVSVPGFNLAATGSYALRVAVHNLRATDTQTSNDTLSVTVLSIPNDTINLATPLFDGFEDMGKFAAIHDSVGISPNGHWDFFTASDSGRVRSFVSENISLTGSRSMSLDAYQSLPSRSRNSLVGTFNLAGYDTATTEIRVDFDYMIHARPKVVAENVVKARANDTSAWTPFFNYDLVAFAGARSHTQSLSLTDAVRGSHKNFSASSQLSFGQSDTTLIATTDYGTGITIDNFRLYTVTNDAAIAGIVSPLPNNCGVASPGPVTVKIHNGVNYTLHNVQVFYNVDGGATYTGTLDSIRAKADVNFTFTQPVNMAPGVTHNLNVWLKTTGDSYTPNDSLLNYRYRNSQVIASYPYLENFESGDGGYYSDGYKSTWQYGKPASPQINKAASGTKAWKTNLNGNYNNLEVSYLYSPCFDLSGMIKPMLSFSMAMDIEYCGNTLCDAAYLEMSYDGVNWSRLGSAGQGTNWYDTTLGVWHTIGFTRWHVASLLLPQPGAGYITHFRFVMAADPGVNFEGIAIDDIHVFDQANSIYNEGKQATATLDVTGTQPTDYLLNNKLLASIQPNGQSVNNATVTLYAHDTLSNQGGTQYTFPASYTISAAKGPADSIGVRLYLLESDVLKVVNDTTCPSCNPLKDAYSLGITQYYNAANKALENGSLTDDTGGVFTYLPYTAVKWVPYDNGYYADFKTQSLSEFWFNDGGPTHNFAANTDFVNFSVYRRDNAGVCIWHSLIDTAVNTYTVQWSLDPVNFANALDTPALHAAVGNYTFNDPINFNNHPVIYYRLKWTLIGSDKEYYSPIRIIHGDDSAINQISYNVAMVNHQSVLNTWTSEIDGITSQYTVERAIGSGAFATVSTLPSLRHFNQSYSIVDKPQGFINDGTILHYRLTAVFDDGTKLQLPEKQVEWYNGNTFTNIYPNPTHDGLFNIQWYADAGTQMHLNITDAAGRSMQEISVTATQWNNTTTLQTGGRLKGVYFIRMEIGGQRHNAKLVFD